MEKIINYQEKTKSELITLLQLMDKNVLEVVEENAQLGQRFSTELEEKNKVIQQNYSVIQKHETTIQQLLEALRLNRYRLYGAKSEKYNPGQFELELGVFNEASTPENVEEIESGEEDIIVAAHVRKKTPGRKPLPKEFPRYQIIHDLTDEQKQCACGHTLSCFGEEKTEQLEIVPLKVYVIEHIEKKYCCKQCEDTVRQAKKPIQPIPRSIAGPGLLAHVLASKFLYHLPLYRQEQQFQRLGIDIARNTLSLWVIRCAGLLETLEKVMVDEILKYDIAYSDESRVQVLKEEGRAAELLSWMWQFSGGPPDKFSVIYLYDVSRGHEVPLTFFEDFKGFLHCDGFSAYELLSKKNKNITYQDVYSARE